MLCSMDTQSRCLKIFFSVPDSDIFCRLTFLLDDTRVTDPFGLGLLLRA